MSLMDRKDIRTEIPSNMGYWNSKFSDLWREQVQQAQKKFPSEIEEIWMPIEHPIDVPIIFVKNGDHLEVLRFFKNELEYDFLSDLTAIDQLPEEPRFEVVYQLYSPKNKNRIRIKCRLKDGEAIQTIIGLWPGANWPEREIWDMFGIHVEGHPDLRRILMDERWVGHPLRKDYPLRGYQLFVDPESPHPELLG